MNEEFESYSEDSPKRDYLIIAALILFALGLAGLVWVYPRIFPLP